MEQQHNYLKLVKTFLKQTKQPQSFKTICAHLETITKAKFDLNTPVTADIYAELILDNDFYINEQGEWTLKAFVKYDDFKKQYLHNNSFDPTKEFETPYDSTQMYNLKDGEVTENVVIVEDLTTKAAPESKPVVVQDETEEKN